MCPTAAPVSASSLTLLSSGRPWDGCRVLILLDALALLDVMSQVARGVLHRVSGPETATLHVASSSGKPFWAHSLFGLLEQSRH